MTACRAGISAHQRQEQNVAFNACLTVPVKLHEVARAFRRKAHQHSGSNGPRCSATATRAQHQAQAAQRPRQCSCCTP